MLKAFVEALACEILSSYPTVRIQRPFFFSLEYS